MCVFSLGSLLGRQPESLLGLDITASSLRLVELHSARSGQWVLERFAVEPLQPGWVSDGGIEQFTEVAEAVQRLLSKSGARTRQVAMALPSSAVITKRIVLPAGLSDPELEILVQGEAEQYIPFSLDEVNLDFCVLGPCSTSATDVDVLIAAARREKVQDLQGLAEAAGLKLGVVDVASLATRRAASRLVAHLPEVSADPVVALFELGDTTTRLQVLRGDESLYERDQSFGEATLVSLIAAESEGSMEDAQRRVLRGDWPQGASSAALRTYASSAVQELTRALQFFYASPQQVKLDHVLLAGAVATVPGLLPALQAQLGLGCSAVNPFEGMAMGPAVRARQLKRQAPAFLAACGLALREGA